MRYFKRLLCLLLCAALLCLAGCGDREKALEIIGAGSSPSPSALAGEFFSHDIARDDVAFSDMEYEHYDYSRFASMAAGIRDMAETGASESEFSDADIEIYWELLYIHTLSELADAAYYADPSDGNAAAECEYMTGIWYDAWDEYCVSFGTLARSEYAELMESGFSDWQIEYLKTYEPMTEEESGELSAESELVQEYYTIMSADAPDYDAVVAVFVELVKLRNAQAEAWGYDSYADYAYESLYYRDYTPDDAEVLRGAVREYFVPVMREYADAVSDRAYRLVYSDKIDCSPEAIMDALGIGASGLSDEVREAYDYLTQYGLYDIEPSESKASMGYTTMLYYYNEPFIFNSPYGNYRDYTDMFHEFGHFLNFYYCPSDLIFGSPDNDLSELQSQGMEAMMTRFYPDFFGDNANTVEADTVMSLVYSVVDGCMYDEFQRRAYSEPELTAERALEIYREVYSEYGYEEYSGCEYEWVDVAHNFQYPFYYISYAVSAVPALELYSLLQESPEKAAEEYLAVAALDPELYYFRDAMGETSLGDPFTESAVKDTASAVSEAFAGLF